MLSLPNGCRRADGPAQGQTFEPAGPIGLRTSGMQGGFGGGIGVPVAGGAGGRQSIEPGCGGNGAPLPLGGSRGP